MEFRQLPRCRIHIIKQETGIDHRGVAGIDDDVLVRVADAEVIGGDVAKDGADEAHRSMPSPFPRTRYG